MDISATKTTVEALLFVSERPVTLAQICSAIEGAERKLVHQVLDELRAEYDEQGRGFKLVEIAEGWQLLSRPSFASAIRRLRAVKSANRLTRPALETLAIIAYKQPITKAEVEDIRGVNSDGVMHNLLERRLVRTVGRKDVVGRPLLYGSTRDFLQAFGLKDLAELPRLTELKDLLAQDPEGELWEVGADGKLIEKPLEDLRNVDGPFAPGADAPVAGGTAEPDLLTTDEAAGEKEVEEDEGDDDEEDDDDEDDGDDDDDEEGEDEGDDEDDKEEEKKPAKGKKR